MRFTKKHAVILVVISLLLFALQAGIWKHSTVQDRSETDKIDTETQHHPTEIPGIAGTCLLVVAGVLLALPHPRTSE